MSKIPHDKRLKISHDKRPFDMIRLLRKNGKMTARELREKLDIKNSRTITRYKNIIRKLGFNIVSESGYLGGYEIIEERLNPSEINEISCKINNIKLIEKIKRINDRI